MDLTEAEDIKKRWQEYTEELYKRDPHDPHNHNGVNTDLEPDILEREVKWALGSITPNKASGGDGIPAELFQILKGDAVKVLHSLCRQIWKTQHWPTKVCLVKAMVFPVVAYGCESWTIKRAEGWRIEAFELWCWRRLLRVPGTARRPNQSIVKEISPRHSLEGLTLKLKLQYFGHLLRRTDTLERSLTLGKIEGGREGDGRGRDGWVASPAVWTWVWAGSWSWWRTGKKELDTTERLNWMPVTWLLLGDFSKEIDGLKSLVKHFYGLCSSLPGRISCGARKAAVQIPAFRSHSLTDLTSYLTFLCLRFLICEMRMMTWYQPFERIKWVNPFKTCRPCLGTWHFACLHWV